MKMNKKLRNFVINNYGLLQVNPYVFEGNIRGYKVTCADGARSRCVLIVQISCYIPNDLKESIMNDLSNLCSNYTRIAFNDFGLIIEGTDLTYGTFMKKFPAKLDRVFDVLDQHSVNKSNDVCPVCGALISDDNSRMVNTGITYNKICNECLEKINNSIDESNRQFNSAPNNYFKGFLGALIGAFVGIALYIVFSLLGFVAMWSSLAAVTVGAKLYEKFGGKPNKMMLVIVCSTTIVLMTAAVFAIYGAFNLLFTTEFFVDLIISTIFTVLGVVVYAFYLKKQIQRPTRY